jgi:uncharacterized protein YktA (UPF0223 family)
MFGGNIFNEGTLVEKINTGEIGRVTRRGSNHLICVTEDGNMFKAWITDVKEVYEVGTCEYRKHAQEYTPGQPIKPFSGKIKIKSSYNKSSKRFFYLVTMSNPWAEVYKDLRSEILDESDFQERRKLRGDIKTAATQTRYDLKSRVAKMRAQGKTDLEIKQYLDKYIANSKLPGEQKAQIRQVALSSGYELEGQQIAEESEKVLVRITTEDGRVFEKKVPREKISDLRKRYKTVVEVGSSEKAPTQTSNKPGGVSEGKHVKRWWDDDGDGKGYEDGEVSGKFKKKKKKIKSESFSDWRYEIQIDENQIGLTPKEMRPSAEEKKNEGESESKLSEHNDTNTWEESDRELANRLAEELGAEVLGVEVLDERIRIPKIPSPRVVTQFMDKIDDVIPNLRLGREPAGAMVPVQNQHQHQQQHQNQHQHQQQHQNQHQHQQQHQNQHQHQQQHQNQHQHP